MEVILRYDVPNVGRAGQAVTVKDGYARNYLLPRGLAEKATKENLARIAAELKRRAIAEAKEREECQTLAARLAEMSVTIPRKAGDDDKLFGSVTNLDISKALEKMGIVIDKKKILVDPPIRQLGIFTVEIALHPEVTANLRVWVVRE
ncbi:MAG: 50S ribosomal protein L9 [bacterium]|nr:50S ribosomal protein L9 [bacterium]